MLEEFVDKSTRIGVEPAIPPMRYTVPVAPVPPITAVGWRTTESMGGVISCIDPVAPVPYWDARIILVS